MTETTTTRTDANPFSSQSMVSVTADLSSQTPLLCASDSDPVSFVESQQPVLPVTAGFDSRSPRYAVSRRRKRSPRDSLLRKRLRMLRILKRGLEAIIAVWTVFNITRYLVSYARYVTSQAQFTALALALSACLSLAFLGCAVLLSLSRKYLHRGIPFHVIRKSLRFIALFLLLAPALVNVVLLFAWQNTDNPELSFQNRCHVDIDLVWSIFQEPCSGSAWGVWIALAFVRLVVTLVVMAAYLFVCHLYGRTVKLSTPQRLSTLVPPTVRSSVTATMKETSIDQGLSKHRPSRSSLGSNVDPTSLSVLPYNAAPLTRITRSRSSTSSEDDYTMRHPPPGLVYDNNQNTEKTTDPDHHFRTHVKNLSQDTDDTHSHSRLSDEGEDEHIEQEPHSETTFASYPAYAAYASQTPYSYNLPPVPPSIGYNEFGQPYPPDEPLPILNGIIRRMPTIESMGSRELGSINSSLNTGTNKLPGSARSTMTFDRPPTRPISRTDLVTMASGGGGNGPSSSSRPNSLGARAELMAILGGNPMVVATSELGELVSPSPTEETVVVNPHGHATATSRTTTASTSRSSTLSFHTATSGSVYSGSPH